jgi:carboxyl-terminal processing protease
MKKIIRKFRWYYAGMLLVLSLSFLSFKASQSNFFEISKNLEIFATLFRELNTYYVDDVDPGKMMKKGIDEMLKTLDPYTNYISESEAEDFRFQMTGQYGGIGAQVGQRGDYVMILEPYENFPAHKADLRAGDVIIEIEGKPTKGKTTSDVSKLLKGQPGSAIKIKIKREGEGELLKELTREEVKVKNVPYVGMIDDKTGYIRLQSFTQDAGKEVREALLELKKNTGITSVILDVRGNPGGLLHEAVNIVNVFIPIGQEVVSTKGKVKEWDKSYRTLNQPVDVTMPLVVLTSRGSASASEIVSGALQDLDRAVVIGTRTFGKGLVQSTRPLTYNAQLKLTTAKYYIPSGRCIQALDYSNKSDDGSPGSLPDSLRKEFKTKGGRKVFDGAGIEPDIKVDQTQYAKITQSLLSKLIIFDYATVYRTKHPSIAPAKMFKLTDTDFEDFKVYISNKEYDYTTQSEQALEELKKKAEQEKYFDAIKEVYENMKKELAHDKQADIDRTKKEIMELLQEEIAKRYYLQRARYEATFSSDDDIQQALRIFADKATYNAILKK